MQRSQPTHLAPALAKGVVVVLTAAVLTLGAAPAGAHPMGNFTVNVYAGLHLTPAEMAVDYVVDLAEVAAMQARPYMDRDGDDDVSDEELTSYGEAGCATWAAGLAIEQDDRGLHVRTAQTNATMTPGEGGLPTLRIECGLIADRPRGGEGEDERQITLDDGNFPQRAGWREITATAEDMTLLSSDVPTSSLSARLAAYPRDRLSSPPNQRSATLTARADDFAPVGVAAADAAVPDPRAGAWTEALSRVVTNRMLEPGLAAVALLAALVLGALHALAPGHGKAVIAAYLVGQRGSVRQAAALALSVTLTHTAGVLVLGALLWTATVTAPERLYPLLGVASGALVAALGAGMLLRARRYGAELPAGAQHHGHGHLADAVVSGQGVGANSSSPIGHVGTQPVLRTRTIVTLGFAGGLVPTPSALLVLLGSLAIGRMWLGVLLVGVYGLGMATSLVGIGVVLVHTQTRLERRLDRFGSARLHALTHALPAVTAGFVLFAGVGLMARSVLAT